MEFVWLIVCYLWVTEVSIQSKISLLAQHEIMGQENYQVSAEWDSCHALAVSNCSRRKVMNYISQSFWRTESAISIWWVKHMYHGTVQGASPAYSWLGIWWNSGGSYYMWHVCLLCMWPLSGVGIPYSVYPSIMEMSSSPAAEKERNLRGLIKSRDLKLSNTMKKGSPMNPTKCLQCLTQIQESWIRFPIEDHRNLQQGWW